MSRSKRRYVRLAILAMAGLMVQGCASGDRSWNHAANASASAYAPQTVPLATALAPVSEPGRPLSESFAARDLVNGEMLVMNVTSVRGGSVRVRESNGCTWTRAGDWFAPSDSWANCDDSLNWHTGRATVQSLNSLWPMRVGAEGRWRRDAVSHTGRSYTRDTVCRVSDSVAVIREGRAPTPTFVVGCSDGKRLRTTWYSPDEGPVAFRQTHSENGVEEAWVRQ